MRGLAGFLSALLRLFQQWARLFKNLTAWEQTVQARPARLREVSDFGSNPGNLRMFSYAPSALGDEAIVRRVADTPEAGRKKVNNVVRAAAASAATVDSSDI